MKPFKDGVLIFEPWYSRLMTFLNKLDWALSVPVDVEYDGLSALEIADEIIVQMEDIGLTVTIPVVGAIWFLILKAQGRIYRGVREKGKVTATAMMSVEENIVTD